MHTRKLSGMALPLCSTLASYLMRISVVLALVLGLGYAIGKAPVWANHATCAENDYLHEHWQRAQQATVKHAIDIINESGATGQYLPAANSGISDWNNNQGHVRFILDDIIVANTIVTVNRFDWAGWGDTVSNADCAQVSSHLIWSDVYLNSRTIEDSINDGTPGGLRQKVGAHELGHSIGLGHPADPNVTAIMKTGWNGYNTVQQWDVNMLTAHFDPYGHSD